MSAQRLYDIAHKRTHSHWIGSNLLQSTKYRNLYAVQEVLDTRKYIWQVEHLFSEFQSLSDNLLL